MKRLLIFTLLFISLVGCAEQNDDLIGNGDQDLPVNLVLAEYSQPLPDVNWELIADLERNPLRLNTFYVPDGSVEHLPDLTDVLNGAFAEGKHFIFVIYRPNNVNHVQFYLLQPAPPVYDESFAPEGTFHFHLFKYHFPSDDSWYLIQTVRDSTYAGFGIEFDLTEDLNNPPRRKYWLPPKFFVSHDHLETGGYRIKDNVRLKIYVNR